jgi:BlaI family transcriptional regulator, penicillinase repressor
METPLNEKLTRREREIMDTLYGIGESASAEEIRKRLSDPPSSSAARAMLTKLEAKGYVYHREEGLKYVYFPTTSRPAAQRRAIEKLVRVFFKGSPGLTAAALLRQETWSDEELDRLRAEIDEVREDRRRSS